MKTMEVRNDADLQAIQTSVAFKNISDAIEQYRRQFGLAFLALIAFSAIHVGLVVIANLYTMETRVSGGVLTASSDATAKPVGVSQVQESYDLSYIMTNMQETSQISALNSVKSINFVDRQGDYRQYTVTGYQLGGWKRSELKLYTSVGHILQYVRGKGLRVLSESGVTSGSVNSTRKLLASPSPPPDAISSPSPPPPHPPCGGYGQPDCHWLIGFPPSAVAAVANLTRTADGLVAELTAEAKGASTVHVVKADGTVHTVALNTFWDDDANHDMGGVNEGTLETINAANKEYIMGLSNAAKAAMLKDTSRMENFINGVPTAASLTNAQLADNNRSLSKIALGYAQDATATLKGSNMWINAAEAEATMEKALNEIKQSHAYQCTTGSCSNGALDSYYAKVVQELEDTYQELIGLGKTVDTDVFVDPLELGDDYETDDAKVDALLLVSSISTQWTSIADTGLIAENQNVTDAKAELSAYTPSDMFEYGCSGVTINSLMDGGDESATAAVIEACIKFADKPFFDSYFFSAFLGYHERFTMYVPPLICDVMSSMSWSGTIDTMSIGITTEYVFMLHGWLGDNTFLHFLAEALYWVFSVNGANANGQYGGHYGAHNGFVVLAPADGSTPMPQKTWYLNNDFTGFHMDMIVFELPEFISVALGTTSRGNGFFGFSMGGWGSFHIAMTYPTFTVAIASFNAPTRPAACHDLDICHLECGVDFILCEMTWTSSQIAFNPYVVVSSEMSMGSPGPYAPTAIGTLAFLIEFGMMGGANVSNAGSSGQVTLGDNDLSCKYAADAAAECPTCPLVLGYYAPKTMKLLSDIPKDFKASDKSGATTASIGVLKHYGYGYEQGNFETSGTGNACFQNWNAFGGMLSCVGFAFYPVAWMGSSGSASYFYLDPVYFTMSSSFFEPTHNTLTDEIASEHAYDNYYRQFVYSRLESNPSVFGNFPLFMLIACDANDQFLLGKHTDSLVRFMRMNLKVGAGLHVASGWVYDKNENVGHNYSQRDIRLTIGWFSDVFRTATGLGDALWETNYIDSYAAQYDGTKKQGAIMARFEAMSSHTWTPCYLYQEFGGCTSGFDVVSYTMPFTAPNGSPVVDKGYVWNPSGGSSGCMASVSGYGGAIDVKGFCDDSIFVLRGHPDGLFPNAIAQHTYELEEFSMSAMPTDEGMQEYNIELAKALCEKNGLSDNCDGTESGFSINFDNMQCWNNKHVKEITLTGGASVNVANCCGCTTLANECMSAISEWFDTTECCPDQISVLKTCSDSYLMQEEFDGMSAEEVTEMEGYKTDISMSEFVSDDFTKTYHWGYDDDYSGMSGM